MDITLPYRIMGVDPATTNSGWAILDVISLYPLRINIVATGHLDGAKLLRTRKEMGGTFTAQFCVLDALQEEYLRLAQLYKPSQIVSEGSFGHLFPAALISLTLAIDVLRRVSKIFLNKDIVCMPPTISKKAATGKGGADKDHMRLAYQTSTWLEGTVSDDQITEHEIDACWHSIAFVKVHILGTIKQISAKDKRNARREKAKAKEEANKKKMESV